jgi:hypothetical protein
VIINDLNVVSNIGGVLLTIATAVALYYGWRKGKNNQATLRGKRQIDEDLARVEDE